MENHLYESMYDLLKRPGPSEQTLPVLNRLKAKNVRLHSRRLQKILEDNNDQPTMYHIFQKKRQRAERTVYSLKDETVQMHTTPSGIDYYNLSTKHARHNRGER
jgi:hypothetical protein